MNVFKCEIPGGHLAVQPAAYTELLRDMLATLAQAGAVERIWANDPVAWKLSAEYDAEIRNRLGWLRLPENMRAELLSVEVFARQARESGLKRVVHLGMGGSSLAPETLRLVLRVAPGWLELDVLDSTDPAQIRRVEAAGSLRETLFIVASKSGTTAETLNLYTYFRERVRAELGDEAIPEHFCVITDPGTALTALAIDEELPYFINPADIGGRFSALSLFGLLPAALLGLDLVRLLDRGAAMAKACQQSAPECNPGLLVGALMGVLAAQTSPSVNKLTLLTSPQLSAFGSWLEQLIAESTGKDGVGILPVVDEELPRQARNPQNRLYACLRLDGDDNTALDARMAAICAEGLPSLTATLSDGYDIAAQFMLWEFATAVAGIVLRINPFDQPDVESAKAAARSALARYESERKLEIGEPVARLGSLQFYAEQPADDARALMDTILNATPASGYAALMAYIDRSPANDALLSELASALADRLGTPVTIGFGPRFLHSTGQLHKGGPNDGTFIQLVQDEANDLEIPGRVYTFGVLKRSQALGDLAALHAAGRRTLSINLGTDPAAGLHELISLVRG
ncbi:MAG: glucose-6-phosphate isomerase [Chloroflexi bacterium]|nr:glucose-6-phosphate isomerase [Chloroflexota bacterium]